MSIFKCKMCGGTIEYEEGATVGVCEYCGTRQTLPHLDDDKKANLYDRANHLRRNNEYDKAMSIYEQILNEDSTDAETYWSLVLCRYGIEYIDDPTTHRQIPTVNRTQFTSILADEDYKAALDRADYAQREIYEQEAKEIDNIQRGILSISQKEEPFDIFICYKETDSNGRRTPDSVLATDLYHQLSQEGFKVFFSRITLENKLGQEYEPYIFAALNSAKVMVVLGTRPDYFNAVWVRNEWNRYIASIKAGAKKTLIPAYRDMDPYDLPEEFSHLQALDMSKLGFMQDLTRGIKKIISDESEITVKESLLENRAVKTSVTPFIKRVFLFLEDEDWSNADEYCEKVLDIDPECAEAYLGKLMAELHVKKRSELALLEEPFDNNKNYKKARRFAKEDLAAELEGYISAIKSRKENARLEKIYSENVQAMKIAHTETEYIKTASRFDEINKYKDSAALAETCREKANESRLNAIYLDAKGLMLTPIKSNFEKAIKKFELIPDYRDSQKQIEICKERILEFQRKAEIQKAKNAENKRRSKKVFAVIGICAIVVIATSVGYEAVIKPQMEYNNAVALMESESYEEAIAAFEALEGYKDAEEQIANCEEAILERDYQKAVALFEKEDYAKAMPIFMELKKYKDSKEYFSEAQFFVKAAEVNSQIDSGDFESVKKQLETLKVLPKAEKHSSLVDKIYFDAAQAVFETKDVVLTEEFIAGIVSPEEITGYAELMQEIEYLKIYNEAKAIEITSNKTKNQLAELCEQLPEDYEGKAELLEAIEEFETKQKQTNSEGNLTNGSNSAIGSEQSCKKQLQGTWRSDNYIVVIKGSEFAKYHSTGEIFVKNGQQYKGTMENFDDSLGFWCFDVLYGDNVGGWFIYKESKSNSYILCESGSYIHFYKG